MPKCQLGMQKIVQGHRIASVCKQTYDASFTHVTHDLLRVFLSPINPFSQEEGDLRCTLFTSSAGCVVKKLEPRSLTRFGDIQVKPNMQLAVTQFAERSAGISSGSFRSRSGPPYRRCYCRAAVQSHISKDRQSELKAIVIGGGFAGLSAAAGLSRQFSQVVSLSCTAAVRMHDLR